MTEEQKQNDAQQTSKEMENDNKSNNENKGFVVCTHK